MKTKYLLILLACLGMIAAAQARHYYDDYNDIRKATDIVNLVGSALNLIGGSPVYVTPPPPPVYVAPPPPPPPVYVAPPPPPQPVYVAPPRPVFVPPPPRPHYQPRPSFAPPPAQRHHHHRGYRR